MEMGYPRQPTQITTDNSTTNSIAITFIIPRKTRSMDIRFHWVRDRVTEKQFIIYWKTW